MTNPTQLPLGLEADHNNQYLFSDHYLDNLLPGDLRWREALAEAERLLAWLQPRYAQEQNHLANYNEAQLEDHWVKPILTRLGHTFEPQASVPGLGQGVKRPDYVFFTTEADRQAAVNLQRTAEYAAKALAVGEAKAWDVPLGKKQRDGGGSFDSQNPSYQIDYYVRTTGLKWGLLTNGRLWRLVHADSSQRLTVYYEVNLIELLNQGDADKLRYFSLFFCQTAFRPDVLGQHFLDDALTASRTYALQLEEDLKENVYKALERLMQGFVHLLGNSLSQTHLAEIYDNSLYLLYRLLFILYGESRGLLPMQQPEYRTHYSLESLKRRIATLTSLPAPMTRTYWSHIQQLFQIINGDNEALNHYLGVPRYNGGLFDPDEHPFLLEKAVGDRALVEAIDLLSRRKTSQGGKEFVDYRTLGVRQLGSIYEGLLEYQPRYATEPLVAIRNGNRKGERWLPAAQAPAHATIIDRREPGQIYLETDKGERKATGSYYTPQYIVEYIITNTLDPLIDAARQRIKAQARPVTDPAARTRIEQSFSTEILNLKILDPAMGSGHFLVEATEYLALALATDPFVTVPPAPASPPVGETEGGPTLEEDLTYWRRRVVERCIYGVDKNPLAVELAKLSLWLATVAADKPLSFIDHHLKCGDALVGAQVTDLGEVPPLMLSPLARREREAAAQQGARQINMFEQRLSAKLPVMLGKILEITARESDSYDTILAKEAADLAVRQLKAPFEAIAHLWSSAYFGHTFSQDDYTAALAALDQPDHLFSQPPIAEALALAADPHRRFFHWELAFPEVFYDRHGQARGDKAGFDAVVGNPPYVSHGEMRKNSLEIQRTLESFYPSAIQGHWDLYIIFIFKAFSLLQIAGLHSFIVPSSLGFEKYATTMREYLLRNSWLTSLTVFGEHQVFEAVARQYLIYIVSKNPQNSLTQINEYTGENFINKSFINQNEFLNFSNCTFRTDIDQSEIRLRNKIDEQNIKLGTLCFATFGVHAYSRSGGEVRFSTRDVIHMASELTGYKRYVEGENISRYSVIWDHKYLDYESKREYFHRRKFPELFETPKLMVRRISGENNRLLGHYDTNGYYTNDNVIHAVLWTETIRSLQSSGEYEIDSEAITYDLKYITAVFNSQLITWYFSKFIATGTLQGTYSGTYPEDIRQLPIRRISFTTPAEAREQLAAQAQRLYQSGQFEALGAFSQARLDLEPEQSDVIHDLLAYLAGQMIAMNQEKQHITADFWLNLEGQLGQDEATFRKLRDKGKQEATLWQKQACRPYVNENSHSSRTLDESLAWDEEAYKGFIAALAGTVSNLARLVQVYRQHTPEYRQLTHRLTATDDLIDQIVFQLYGLDGDEMAHILG